MLGHSAPLSLSVYVYVKVNVFFSPHIVEMAIVDSQDGLVSCVVRDKWTERVEKWVLTQGNGIKGSWRPHWDNYTDTAQVRRDR